MTYVGNTKLGKRILLLLFTVAGALLVSSGMALAAAITCQIGADCLGTKNADTLEGTAERDYIYARGGGDTLRGLGEFDELYGQSGADKVFGGPGNDSLIGGSGQDTLSGGGGIDLYYFGPAWGEDSINEGARLTYGVAFDGGSFFHGTNVTESVTDGLTIRFVPGAGPEVKTGDGANTVNWESNVIRFAVGGAGDDEITGNNLGNVIVGRGGDDTIRGAGGDDEVDVADGSDGDVVDCGEDLIGGPDNDGVHYDLGDVVSSNCEAKILNI
jgi:Ca2+-binding RTX toxin-like protein